MVLRQSPVCHYLPLDVERRAITWNSKLQARIVGIVVLGQQSLNHLAVTTDLNAGTGHVHALGAKYCCLFRAGH